MEYNFLLFNDNKLLIKENEKFLSLNQENLINLKEEITVISTFEIKVKNPLSMKVLEHLINNEVVICFDKVSSALKEIEDNKIIAHLNRENFKKISFPIFVQSKYLKNYLKFTGFKFELSTFLEISNFQEIGLNS